MKLIARLLLGLSLSLSLSGSASADTLLVSNVFGDAVLEYDDLDGSFLGIFASGNGLSAPHDLILGPDGLLYIGNRGMNSVQRWDPMTGVFVDEFVAPNSGGLSNTHGMAFGPDGNLYVCSLDTDEVLRYDGTTGAFIDVFVSGNGLTFPYDVEFTPTGTLLVTDALDNEILEFDATTGAFLGVFASGSPADAPVGLTFGPDGNVYVANRFNSSIVRYAPDGQLIDVFVPGGSGGLDGPIHLAFGPDGDLYVTDFPGGSVRRYDGVTGAYVEDFVPYLSGGLNSPSFLLFLPDPPPVPEIRAYVQGAATAVNAGGGAYVSGAGTLFSADQPFDGNFGYTGGGGSASFGGDVLGTDDDALYLDMRWGTSLTYSFGNLAPGDYDARLHFMEPVLTAPGQRITDILVEGQLALAGFDPFAAAGGTFTATTADVTATVLDGQLDIDFVSVSRVAIVSGITLEARANDFGLVPVGSSADAVVTIENPGTGDLTVSSLTMTDPDFSVVSPAAPFVVAAGGSTDVVVRFTPSGLGAVSGSLQIANDDPDEALVEISLMGTGDGPPPNEPDINVSPGALDLGDVVVGSMSAPGSVQIVNQGNQPLTISSLDVTNGAFSAAGPNTPPFVLAPSGSATIDVVFAPTAAGSAVGSLDITSDDPDEGVVSVSLSGEGVAAPEFRVNAGDGVFTSTSGDTFSADQPFTSGGFGYSTGQTASYTQPISGTVDDALYQSLRGAPSFNYSFDALPVGDYQVTLHFMEPFWSTTGQRVFDVLAEGVLTLDNYDIVAQTGSSFAATTETFTVSVSDGRLEVQFTGVVRKPLLAGIEVVYVP